MMDVLDLKAIERRVRAMTLTGERWEVLEAEADFYTSARFDVLVLCAALREALTLLAEFASSPAAFEDERLRYTEIQVSKSLLREARDLLERVKR